MTETPDLSRLSPEELAEVVRDVLDLGRRDVSLLSGRNYKPRRWGHAENHLEELVCRVSTLQDALEQIAKFERGVAQNFGWKWVPSAEAFIARAALRAVSVSAKEGDDDG